MLKSDAAIAHGLGEPPRIYASPIQIDVRQHRLMTAGRS